MRKVHVTSKMSRSSSFVHLDAPCPETLDVWLLWRLWFISADFILEIKDVPNASDSHLLKSSSMFYPVIFCRYTIKKHQRSLNETCEKSLRGIGSNLTSVQKSKWLIEFPYFSGKVKEKKTLCHLVIAPHQRVLLRHAKTLHLALWYMVLWCCL